MRVELDAHIAAAEELRRNACRPRSQERIEDAITVRGEELDEEEWQGEREGRAASPILAFGRDMQYVRRIHELSPDTRLKPASEAASAR